MPYGLPKMFNRTNIRKFVIEISAGVNRTLFYLLPHVNEMNTKRRKENPQDETHQRQMEREGKKGDLYAPYVLGDDLLGAVREVEVDEIGEQSHGRERTSREWVIDLCVLVAQP